MKIIEAINRIDSLKPNQYDVKTKITWLSYLDGEIRRTVIDTHEGRPTTAFSNYTENDIDKELVVEPPFDELYVTYLSMKIDEANCEATRYNNSAMMFNTQMQNFRVDYNRTHMPIQQGFRCRRPIPHDVPCDYEVPLSPPPVPSIPIAGESFGMIKVDPQDEYLSMDNGGFLRVDAEKIKEETLADLPEGGESGSGDGYTKAETDALLEDKADKILTYTKSEVDALIPSVPIKGIKANGASLTPNASGVVDIDTKDLFICTIRKQGNDWTIDKEAPDIDEAFSEGKRVVADIYDNYTFTRVPFNGYAFVRIDDDGTNTVVEWWYIITETMVDPFTGEETYDRTTIYYVTRTIPQSSGSIDAYTKSEMDTLLNSKANANIVYTKSETDALIPNVPIKSISLNGATVSPDAQGNVALSVSSGGGSASTDVVIKCTADYDTDWQYPFRLILPTGMTYADIKDKIITFEVPIDASISVTGTEVHIWTGSYYIDDDIYLCLSPYSGASYNGILFGEGELASFLITEYNGQIYGLATNMSAKRYYQNIDDRINANIPEVPVKSVSFNGTPVNPDAQGNVAINYAYTISSAEKEDIADMVQADMEAVELTGTLTAGQTSLTLSDEAISTNSIIDIYVDKWGVSPTNVTTSTGSITMTFTAQESNMSVKVIVRNPDYDALAGVREEVYIGTVQPSASEGYKLWINPSDTPSSGGGSNLELLWTNSAASSASFSAQTISLDLSDYKAVEVVFLVKASYSSHVSQSCFVDLTDRIFVGSYDDEVKFFDRIVKPTSTGVQFYDGANNGAVDNTVCVPRYIYGIK